VLPRAKYFPDQPADDFDGPMDDEEGEAAKAGITKATAPASDPASNAATATEEIPLDLITAAFTRSVSPIT